MIILPDIPPEQVKPLLTLKEYECYLLTQEGNIGKQIAQKLYFTSRSSVYKMKKRILKKLLNQ
jgi:DNA-binding CsgD family transcriptional regulator